MAHDVPSFGSWNLWRLTAELPSQQVLALTNRTVAGWGLKAPRSWDFPIHQRVQQCGSLKVVFILFFSFTFLSLNCLFFLKIWGKMLESYCLQKCWFFTLRNHRNEFHWFQGFQNCMDATFTELLFWRLYRYQGLCHCHGKTLEWAISLRKSTTL